MHAERGDWATAEGLFRKVAEAGHTAGMLNLAQALSRRGQGGEAERWLRTALSGRAGGGAGKVVQAQPAADPPAGDVAAVADWLRGPAASGDADARAALDLLGEADAASRPDSGPGD